MGDHLVIGGDGRKVFQSDKYPSCPAGKVPLSTRDPMAQDLLWEYAQRRREVDSEFSADLEDALKADGFLVPKRIVDWDYAPGDWVTIKGSRGSRLMGPVIGRVVQCTLDQTKGQAYLVRWFSNGVGNKDFFHTNDLEPADPPAEKDED